MERASLLARFATEKKRITQQAVKRKLFQPNKQLQTSVFRIGDLSREDIQAVGVEVVHQHPNARCLYGWAELPVQAVYDVGLQIEHDDNPPGHSNIVGWPEETDKSNQLQHELALRARPVLLSSPIEVSDEAVAP